MKHFVPLFFALVLMSSLLQAQEAPSTSVAATQSAIGLTAAAGPSVYSASLSFERTHGLLRSKKLRLGYGARLHGFGGGNLTYITAPFRLTQDPALIDTLQVGNPVTAGLSATLHLGYFITTKLQVGFNIDVLGVGFGATGVNRFESSDNSGQHPKSVRATPTAYNVLLVGDNDIGQLKSEFLVTYDVSDALRIKVGADFTFSEYTTAQELTHDNDRFRYKAMMGMVGVSYVFERKSNAE